MYYNRLMRKTREKPQVHEPHHFRELEVMPETALEFAQWVRNTQRKLFQEPLKMPKNHQVIEFGQEYRKRKSAHGPQYFLMYYAVVKALRLAEEDTTQLPLIDTLFQEEKEVAIFAFKDQPEDEYIFTHFWSLMLFLEKLRKEDKLEITTTERLTELYLTLRAHLPFDLT